MKRILILLFLIKSFNSYSQPSNRLVTTSLLNWLVKSDHIRYLKPASDDAVFYGKDYLTMKSVLKSDNSIDTNQSLSNYLKGEEIAVCKAALPYVQTKSQNWYKQLPVIFTDNVKIEKKLFDQQKLIYRFSNPLYLNKKATRVLVGEYFICGIACGRGDMLLCEFKEGKWQLIARSVITSD